MAYNKVSGRGLTHTILSTSAQRLALLFWGLLKFPNSLHLITGAGIEDGECPSSTTERN